MNITERHESILDKLKQNGSVSVQHLNSEFDVSDVTIRKDLRILEEKGLLFRTHGGASLHNPYASNKSVNEKEKIHTKEKESIAREAVKLIGDSDSIILASGTTILALARQIHPDREINVITSALNVSLEIANHNNVDIIQLGGKLRKTSSSVVGSYAENFLENITCSTLFLGVDGIDIEYGLTTTNLQEATLNERFINTAHVTVVLADSSKFGKRGFGKICSIDKVQHIITDEGVKEDTVEELEEKGIKVTIAR